MYSTIDFGRSTIENRFVLVRVGKNFIALMLIVMLGAQWALLQSVAWTAMLADNLCTHSFSESLSRTFDGKHPCPICMAIVAGKKSEKKNDFSFQSQKLEFPPINENVALIAPSQFELLPQNNLFAKSFLQKPLLPPPRGFSV